MGTQQQQKEQTYRKREGRNDSGMTNAGEPRTTTKEVDIRSEALKS